MTSSTIDGVHRLQDNGLNVVVIGAGVAGLQAALELWRKGCNPVVLEKADKLSPIGDFFTITPSALTTLKHYPTMFAEYHQSVYRCSVNMLTPSGSVIHSSVAEWDLPGIVHAAPDVDVSFLKRRPEFAQMQLNQVNRLGIPVNWGDGVVAVDESADGVVVTTSSGKTYKGDLCIGANGIASSVRGFNAGPDGTVQDSGYAIARVAFPRRTINADRPAAALLRNIERDPQFRTYVSKDIHLILFLTKDWVAFALTHAMSHVADLILQNSKGSEESWSNFGSSEGLLSYLETTSNDWDPAVLDFVRAAPNEIVDWKLRWRDVKEQWTSDFGRLIKIGDAAHAFLPTAGNGAVQALEDAVSLAECIHVAGADNVAEATKVHNKLRFERVSILQHTGFINRDELHNVDFEAVDKEPEHGKKVGFFRLGRWVWSHDPAKYARDNYAACAEALANSEPFKNTNLPPGHVYKPWSLQSEKEKREAGIKSDLKSNGYWGI